MYFFPITRATKRVFDLPFPHYARGLQQKWHVIMSYRGVRETSAIVSSAGKRDDADAHQHEGD